MTEYTAHIQLPDAAIGAVLHDAVLGYREVDSCTLRSNGGTWLSFGINEDSDDAATMVVASIRYHASRETDIAVPLGYEKDSLASFETAPMILTCGRTVIHSEGI